MDFLEYINSYHICAINHVCNNEQMSALVDRYPDVFSGSEASFFFSGNNRTGNIRFEDGQFASFLSHAYYVGDFFGCEAAINMDDLFFSDIESENNLNIDDIL